MFPKQVNRPTSSSKAKHSRTRLEKNRDQALFIGWPLLAESFQRDLDKLKAKQDKQPK